MARPQSASLWLEGSCLAASKLLEQVLAGRHGILVLVFTLNYPSAFQYPTAIAQVLMQKSTQ